VTSPPPDPEHVRRPPPSPDPVVWCTPDGEEIERTRDADALLGPTPLPRLLTAQSRRKLGAVLERPRAGVELVTSTGTTLDVTVAATAGGHRVLILRDVTRYATAAEKLAGVTRQLARRNRDLEALNEAAARLGATRDVVELAEVTCRLLADELAAEAVTAEVDGHLVCRPHAQPARAADGSEPLPSSHGPDGILRWWRHAPLDDGEQRLVTLIAGRAAVGLDHARLLERSEHLADHDALTGVLNRYGGRRALPTLALPGALVLLDLDRFKRVNDVHGHELGDQVLRRVAEVLVKARATDVVVRWGGEEFLLVLPATSTTAAHTAVDRLRARVAEGVRVEGTPVTFSAGVAELSDPGSFEHALRRADEALYEAKRRGRDQVLTAPAVGRADPPPRCSATATDSSRPPPSRSRPSSV
jgi:diguanylate cyclase (GGDEF)-like protein